MGKKIRMLGMEIENFSLREEVMQSEDFYNRPQLNIIRTISLKMLAEAADSQAVRDGMKQADLLVAGDREILTEAGIYSVQRLKEVSGHEFMREFLSRVERCGHPVFLAAQEAGDLKRLQHFIKTSYENMAVVGSYVLAECGGDYDMAVNEINAADADILISVLDCPQEDLFLQAAKDKIRARVWYSLGNSYRRKEQKMSFTLWFRHLIHKGRFKNKIHRYDESNGEE